MSGWPERRVPAGPRDWVLARVGFLTDRVKDEGFGGRHESEYWLEVARAVGAEAGPTLRAEIHVSDKDRAEADRLLPTNDETPRVALHPGSGDLPATPGAGPGKGSPRTAGELSADPRGAVGTGWFKGGGRTEPAA